MAKQYYTSSDSFVFVEGPNDIISSSPVLIDDLESIAYSESLMTQPTYGLGGPLFGFTSLGNLIVSGELNLRFIDSSYLYNAVKSSILSGQSRDSTSPTTVNSIRKAKSLRNFIAQLDASDIFTIPSYFNIRIIMNNESLYNTDYSRNILIKDVRVIGTDFVTGVPLNGPINIKYKFLARSIQPSETNNAEDDT